MSTQVRTALFNRFSSALQLVLTPRGPSCEDNSVRLFQLKRRCQPVPTGTSRHKQSWAGRRIAMSTDTRKALVVRHCLARNRDRRRTLKQVTSARPRHPRFVLNRTRRTRRTMAKRRYYSCLSRPQLLVNLRAQDSGSTFWHTWDAQPGWSSTDQHACGEPCRVVWWIPRGWHCGGGLVVICR